MSNTVFLALAETTTGHGGEDARKLLASLYKSVTGEDMPPLVKTPLGKPLFSHGGWHCSITHTKRLVCCALSRCPVGVDAEALDRPVGPGLPQKVLTPPELEEYEKTKDPRQYFLEHWVLREAYLKFIGKGLSGDWKTTRFRVLGEAAVLDGCSLSFSLLHRQEHIIALCCKEEPVLFFY